MENKLAQALLFLRLSVFLVMLMWTLDKFIQPDHAIRIYEHFYFLGGFGKNLMMAFGLVELVILTGFLLGVMKAWTYGAVLAFHSVSTLSSFKLYLTPFGDGPNLLFFAAWPMLAACYTLFILRDQDTLLTISEKT